MVVRRTARRARPHFARTRHNAADLRFLQHSRVRFDHRGRLRTLADKRENRPIARRQPQGSRAAPTQLAHKGVGREILNAPFLRHRHDFDFFNRELVTHHHRSLFATRAADEHQIFAPCSRGGHTRPGDNGELNFARQEPLRHHPGSRRDIDRHAQPFRLEEPLLLRHVGRHLAHAPQ